MNLPNKITLSRICLIPVFVLFFYLDVVPYHTLIAAVVFVVAACTDFVDGHIARSRNLVTNLGKFLDPIADKVLVSTALIVMAAEGSAFTVFGEWGAIAGAICISVILARELIVSGFRMIAAGQNIVLAADMLGKVKTVFQDVSIAALLVGSAFLGTAFGEIVVGVGLGCFAVCTVLTVASGINYIVRNRQVLTDEKALNG